MNDTVIVSSCVCGWVGVASSLAEAEDNFRTHDFDSLTGCHKAKSMAMSYPLANSVIEYLRNEATLR
jgi:hypothetical protein